MRDKVITIRVNSRLLEDVKCVIDSKTEVSNFWDRKYYRYHDEKRPNVYDKFTIADLFEEKLREYLEEQNQVQK